MSNQHFIVEQTDNGVLLVRDNVEGKEVKYVPGLSTADSEDLNRPRDREGYINNFLNEDIKVHIAESIDIYNCSSFESLSYCPFTGL